MTYPDLLRSRSSPRAHATVTCRPSDSAEVACPDSPPCTLQLPSCWPRPKQSRYERTVLGGIWVSGPDKPKDLPCNRADCRHSNTNRFSRTHWTEFPRSLCRCMSSVRTSQSWPTWWSVEMCRRLVVVVKLYDIVRKGDLEGLDVFLYNSLALFKYLEKVELTRRAGPQL